MRRFFKILIICAVVVTLPFVVFQIVYPVPTSPDRSDSVFLHASENTELATLLAPVIAQHQDTSGVLWLNNGFDAFAEAATEVAADFDTYWASQSARHVQTV